MYTQDFGIAFGWANAIEPASIEDYKFNGQFCKSGIAF